jgi:glycosyltransferase involved in cell wall biosynthesis
MKKSLFDFIKHGFILHPDVYFSKDDTTVEIIHFQGGKTITLTGIWSHLPTLIQTYGTQDKILEFLITQFPTVDKESIQNDLIDVLFQLYKANMLARSPINPFISFVIPAFNAEASIEALLESIFNQETKHHFEVIVVNNNSTDRTSFLASKYPVIILDEKRKSRSYARNRGLRAARGKFIAFIDSDVQLGRQWIEKTLSGFELDEIVAVQSAIQYSAILSRGILKTHHDQMNHWSIKGFANAKRLPIPFFDTAAVMIRKDFLIDNNIFFDTTLGRSEDVDLSFQCLNFGGCIAFIAEVITKDLGHSSLYRYFGSLFRQAYWDRRMIKKWLPSLGIVAPTYWGFSFPSLPKALNKDYLFSFVAHITRWIGWWISSIFEKRIKKDCLLSSIPSQTPTLLQAAFRIAITPEIVRIVAWNEKDLLGNTGFTLNHTARFMLLTYLSTKDAETTINTTSEKYNIDKGVIANDFSLLTENLRNIGVLV